MTDQGTCRCFYYLYRSGPLKALGTAVVKMSSTTHQGQMLDLLVPDSQSAGKPEVVQLSMPLTIQC